MCSLCIENKKNIALQSAIKLSVPVEVIRFFVFFHNIEASDIHGTDIKLFQSAHSQESWYDTDTISLKRKKKITHSLTLMISFDFLQHPMAQSWN